MSGLTGAETTIPSQVQNSASVKPSTVKDAPLAAVEPSGTTPLSTDVGTVHSSDKVTQASNPGVSFGPLKTPFTTLLPGIKPPATPELSPQQETKYQDLLATVSAWTTVPTTALQGSSSAAIADEERMWLTRECLLRYLRATKWNAIEAPKRLLATLTWRREYGLSKFTPDYISPENETGKQVVLGYDIAARPCLYLRPSQQNTQKSERQIQHLVFMIERVIDIMVPGQDALTLLCNFKDSGAGSNPNVGQGRQVLNILQGHYPERLGRALITNVPWAVWGFFKLITPFIDPLTREKMKFNEDLRLHVPPSHLWSIQGGDVEFEYDHAIYWPALIKLAKDRREAFVERWIRAGKHVGESEAYLKGGDEKSVGERDNLVSSAVTAPSSVSGSEKTVGNPESTSASVSLEGKAILEDTAEHTSEATMPAISELKV